MREILRLLEAFTFRAYAIGGRRSDTGVTRLNGLAHNVHQQSLNYEGLIGQLKEITYAYGNAQRLLDNLRSEDFYHNLTGRDIKYLLTEYEIHLRKVAKEDLTLAQAEILSRGNKWQVEHILPQNPADADEMSEEMELLHQQHVHKLGNLTVTAWNPRLSNKSFEEKRDGAPNINPKIPAYAESDLRIQRDLKRLPGMDARNHPRARRLHC